jgi:hypothetical protein
MERLGQEPVATGRLNKSATPSHYFRRLRRAATDRRATGAQHSTSRPRRDSDKRQSPWAARTSVRLSAIKPDGPGAQLLAKLAVLVPAHRPPTGPGAARPRTQMPQPGGPAHGGSAAVTPATPATSGSAARANSDNQAQPAGRPRAPARQSTRLRLSGPGGLPAADRRQPHRQSRPPAAAPPRPNWIIRLSPPAARGHRRGGAADSDSPARRARPRWTGGSHIGDAGHPWQRRTGQLGMPGSARRPPTGTGAAERRTRILHPFD